VNNIKKIQGQYCLLVKPEQTSTGIIFFSKTIISNIKNYFQHYLNETVEVDFVNLTTLRYTVELISYLRFETNQTITSKDDEIPCLFVRCGQILKRNKMRGHVGAHILNNDLQPHPNLCGFCGKNGCNSILYISSGTDTWSVKSNCKYFYDFSLKAAAKSSKNTPCTNRPVKCEICPAPLNIVWTYDLRPHYTNLHSLVTVQNDGIISSVEINATLAFLKKRQNFFFFFLHYG
jgi:hypothetical protein